VKKGAVRAPLGLLWLVVMRRRRGVLWRADDRRTAAEPSRGDGHGWAAGGAGMSTAHKIMFLAVLLIMAGGPIVAAVVVLHTLRKNRP